MNKIQGKGVCGAVTMGKLYFYKKDNDTISRKTITDPEAEQQRFDRASDPGSRNWMHSTKRHCGRWGKSTPRSLRFTG